MRSPAQNILITGKPGCGKTTVVEKVARTLGERAGGFLSREIRRGRSREGFSLSTLDGRKGILAHIDFNSTHRVGRYGVNICDIEKIAVPSIQEAVREGKVVIIDEIARMELYCEAFRDAVEKALDSPSSVLATIQLRQAPFLNAVRSRSDVHLITLTKENRNPVAEELAQLLVRSTP